VNKEVYCVVGEVQKQQLTSHVGAYGYWPTANEKKITAIFALTYYTILFSNTTFGNTAYDLRLFSPPAILYKNCRKRSVNADFTCSLSGSELGEIVTPAADYSSAMCATCESNTLLLSMPSAMH